MVDQRLVAAGAIALAVTLFSIFSMRPLARKMGLVDRPHGRKRHNGRVPLIGGLCFFIGTMVGLCYLGPVDNFVMSLATGATLIMVTGLVDDFHEMSVRSRLLIEACVVGWLIAISGVHIDDLGPLVGNHGLALGLLGIPLTIIAVTGLINAFNMLDGIDGLAAATAMISILATLAFGDYAGPSLGVVMLLQILFASLIPYVCVNLGWPDGRKIFMGDAGSTLIGFLLAWSLVYLSHGAVARLRPVDVLWCIAFPVIETLAVMCRRVRSGDSPFKSDRRHFHYLLLDAGYSPRTSLLIVLTVAGLMSALGYPLRDAPQLVGAIAFLAMLAGYVLGLPQAMEILRRQRAASVSGAGPLAFFRLGDVGVGFPGSMLSNEPAPRRAEVAENPVLPASTPTPVVAAGIPGPQLKALCVMAAPADANSIAPIARQLSSDTRFDSKVCIAAASREQADQVRELFDIHVDFNVEVSGLDARATGVRAACLGGMERVLNDAMPDVVLLDGDAPTALATTLAAYAREVPIVCVSTAEPAPKGAGGLEDADCRIVRALASLIVAPSETIRNELMDKGVGPQRILLGGPGQDGATCRRVLEALVELRPARLHPATMPSARGHAIDAGAGDDGAGGMMQKAS